MHPETPEGQAFQALREAEQTKLQLNDEIGKVRRVLKALEEHEKFRNSSTMGKKNAMSHALANANNVRRIT